MKFELREDQRDAIIPANIVLDHALRVVRTGPVIAKRFPQVQPGAALHDHFDVRADEEPASIAELAGSTTVVSLQPRAAETSLDGWVLSHDGGYLLVLRLSLEDYSLDGSGLQISDFAPGDPTIHARLMFSMQRALLEEQRLMTLELDQARQKSVEVLNRVSRMAGFLAHDFNNFLSIIRLNSDRLALELDGNARLTRLVDIIDETATRGSAITRSLMTLALQRDDSRIPVVLDLLIEENLAFFSTAVGARVTVRADLGAAEAVAKVSPAATLNSLVNILINARDALPAGGEITIRTATRRTADGPRMIEIEIADNGQGMSADVLARAFEPLFSAKPGGNGLGLASVHDFAVESGGGARIESAPGIGTRVFLLLPVCTEAPKPANRRPSISQPAATDCCDAEILVVDDEPYALEALCELLGAEGFRVTGCTSVETALEELERRTYRVLLSDIVLPGESGADLARAACRIDPGIKVILMSGYVPAGEDLDDDWMFLRKPIDTRVVTGMLRAMTSAE